MKNRLKLLSHWVSTGLLLGMGFLTTLVMPKPVQAAEEIRLIVGGPGLVLPLSVDSLDTFAQTGEIAGDLRLFARFLDQETLMQIRQGLQRPMPYTVVQVDNIAYSSLGQDTLQNLGKVIRTHPEVNGYHGLRAAMIAAAAAAPEGWTIIDVMRQFPSQSIDVRLPDLLALRRALAVYLSYNQAVVAAIQSQAAAEAVRQGTLEPSSLRDLTQPGPYPFEQSTVPLANPVLRQTSQGLQETYDLTVNIYLPQGLSQPAPVVIISHGFGDVQASFDFIAQHLASHGFAVLVPSHVGSNLSFRQDFLQGLLNTVLSPLEFLSRPQEISFLIDELERWAATSPEWAAQLNLDQIGVLGDSLGGSTALALAGAEISFAHLEETCNQDLLLLNLSLYLQCQARFLPPQNRNLRDPRIKAAVAAHPLGGALYGPEGIGQIEIPLLMAVGSRDIVASTITEQIHPFIWTQSAPKYLALLTEGTHFTTKPGRGDAAGLWLLLTGEHRDIGSRYFNALNLAFWRAHLQGQTEYLPYLTAGYGQWLSQGEPLQLDIIQSLTAESLVAAYGRTPPIPIIPASVTTAALFRDETALAEIERTGVLKVAIRRDAAPFGYLDRAGNWTGYCRDFAADLQAYVSQTVGKAIDVDLVELPSTLANRFSLVQENIVHLECGPNTIRQDIEGVTFSLPLLVSGAQFLVKQERVDRENPNPRLVNIRVAVLPETTTEEFVRETFPQAEVIPFAGPMGRHEAVIALATGQVDVFASDGILSMGELLRQNQPLADYALEPERPLTCEFYGLVLPAGDPDWQNLVNAFISNTHSERLSRQEPNSLFADQLTILDYCLNQQTDEPME